MKSETLIAEQAEKIAQLEDSVSTYRKVYILKSRKYENLWDQIYEIRNVLGKHYGRTGNDYLSGDECYISYPLQELTKEDMIDMIRDIKY